MPKFLIDKSALARMKFDSVRQRLAPIIEAGEAATCAIVELEILYSARNYVEYIKIRQRRNLAYHRIPLTEIIFERATDVQQELARIGHHRLPIPDLILAATAESEKLTLLHYDHDFDLISRITQQATDWVVKAGSV